MNRMIWNDIIKHLNSYINISTFALIVNLFIYLFFSQLHITYKHEAPTQKKLHILCATYENRFDRRLPFYPNVCTTIKRFIDTQEQRENMHTTFKKKETDHVLCCMLQSNRTHAQTEKQCKKLHRKRRKETCQ